MSKCFFCNSDITVGDGEFPISNCPICGKYRVLHQLAMNLRLYKINREQYRDFLYYHKNENKIFLVGTKEDVNNHLKSELSKNKVLVSEQEIQSWQPKNLNDKIDLILLAMGQRIKYIGDTLFIHKHQDEPLLFITQNGINEDDKDICIDNQAKFILDAMSELGYIKYEVRDTNGLNIARSFEVTILAKGFSRIYDLQKLQVTNKNVFVAMSFHESANEIRKAIKQGIEDAEYSSLLMDEIVHNHQIVPEMLRLIKESRFMIMDITQPNFGAYYEAGYAQGLGKEVIITCSQEVWDKKDFSCDKDENCIYKQISTKPHFDIVQKQILKWKDYADLTKQLAEWIKHIIG